MQGTSKAISKPQPDKPQPEEGQHCPFYASNLPLPLLLMGANEMNLQPIPILMIYLSPLTTILPPSEAPTFKMVHLLISTPKLKLVIHDFYYQ